MSRHEIVVIFGATSSIARKVAQKMCQRDIHLILVGRNEVALTDLTADLAVRGGTVSYKVCELTVLSTHEALINDLVSEHGHLDVVLFAYGTLPDQKRCEADAEMALAEITTNFLSVQSLVSIIANHMEIRRAGTIAVISSVAGDRGRQSNYIYGSAKGALTIYLQGLRNRLAGSDVHVLTIKPGFVDTPMTKDFEKGLLWVGPEKVAADIICAIDKRKDVIYTPWFWMWIMLLIKFIPETLFKRLKL